MVPASPSTCRAACSSGSPAGTPHEHGTPAGRASASRSLRRSVRPTAATSWSARARGRPASRSRCRGTGTPPRRCEQDQPVAEAFSAGSLELWTGRACAMKIGSVAGPEGVATDQAAVQELFRKAIAQNDSAAMREGLERLLGVAEGRGLSADEEYKLRSAEFVMEMPQSG